MENARVILIGGAAMLEGRKVGCRVAGELGWGCVSTGDLAEAIKAVTTGQSHPHIHLLEKKDYRMYMLKNTPARLAADAEYCIEGMWPAVKGVILKHAQAGEPIVMEGWHLLPGKVASLGGLGAGVVAIWLIAERGVLEQRLREQTAEMGAEGMTQELMEKFVERSRILHDNIRQAAGERGMPVVKVLKENTVEDISKVCSAIINQYI